MNTLMNANPFIGRTATTPRPTEATYRGTEASFRLDCERWDAAKTQADDNAQRRADHIAGIEAKREEVRVALTAEAETRFTDELRGKYFAADPGATEAEFQVDLPLIRRQHRIKAALAGPAPATVSRF
jgi:hypothetical protein